MGSSEMPILTEPQRERSCGEMAGTSLSRIRTDFPSSCRVLAPEPVSSASTPRREGSGPGRRRGADAHRWPPAARPGGRRRRCRPRPRRRGRRRTSGRRPSPGARATAGWRRRRSGPAGGPRLRVSA
ncbi:MAG: hypothetical protein MZV64_43730 [Ignavibacteriales bacterium]|nr:hypothetical protein [Ignavibacteriales bacterium]